MHPTDKQHYRNHKGGADTYGNREHPPMMTAGLLR